MFQVSHLLSNVALTFTSPMWLMCFSIPNIQRAVQCGSYFHLPRVTDVFQVSQTSHVLSSVALNFTSPVSAHTPSTFTLSGYPSLVTSISWSFGDGAKRDNTTLATVSHTYTYPGSFLLRVDLCWSGVCRSVQVQVRVKAGNVQTSLTCPLLTEVSEKISLNLSLSNSYTSQIKWSRTSAAGSVYGTGVVHKTVLILSPYDVIQWPWLSASHWPAEHHVTCWIHASDAFSWLCSTCV